MKVAVVVTRTCHHRPVLEQHLKDLGIPYEVRYAEDDPEFMRKYDIQCSPNLMVDGEILYRRMPTLEELKELQRSYKP